MTEFKHKLLYFQKCACSGSAGAAHEGERDGGAGELQDLGQPLGHRAPLLRLHPKAGNEYACSLHAPFVHAVCV